MNECSWAAWMTIYPILNDEKKLSQQDEGGSHQAVFQSNTFIFRGYNPYIGGLKPAFFMVLGSICIFFLATWFWHVSVTGWLLVFFFWMSDNDKNVHKTIYRWWWCVGTQRLKFHGISISPRSETWRFNEERNDIYNNLPSLKRTSCP